MDPDQLHAAEDLVDAAECAGGEESWARALLRRGWELSQKAAIAGVAATTAPVVAPPIIILSIAGVALSVPFAACLASLVATDRLMGALLPPTLPQPCSTNDLRDEESEQEFVDASDAPDEKGPVFGYWSKTEEDAIMEQNESFASLPLSRDPALSEELLPLLANEEIYSAGVLASEESGHEFVVPTDGKQKDNDTAMEVDNEYITMEAPSRGDVSVSEVPVSFEKDSIIQEMEDASVSATISAQQLSVSDNENKTEDGKFTIAVKNASRKDMLLPGLHTTAVGDSALPILGDDDVMVQRYKEGGVSGRKSGKDSHISERGDKSEQRKTTQVIPPKGVSVSELQGWKDNTFRSKLEDEIALETALQEELGDANPVIGEEFDVQLGDIPTAEPESELFQSRHQMAPELLAMPESAYVDSSRGSNLTEGIVKDADNKNAEVVEHNGGEDVPTMVAVDDKNDLISSRTELNVTTISDDMTSVEIKPHADHPNQTTCVANKEHRKEEVAEDKCVKTKESKNMDDKVPTTDMGAQVDGISRTPVRDNQSTKEDEATVEMMLEEVTSGIDPVAGEVIEVEVDIMAPENESLPLSDLVAHELQVLTRAGLVDDEIEDIAKGVQYTNVVNVENQSGEGASSFVAVTSVRTVDDGGDLRSSRSTPFVSVTSDEMTSEKGMSDLEYHHQTTRVEYKVMDREFRTKKLAEDKDIYTEEQLREQLNTLRTITGYCAVPYLTLEGELASLYIFVGVEPPESSGPASDLAELSAKLRFLKSIIGVE